MSKPRPTCDSVGQFGMRCARPPKHRGDCHECVNGSDSKHFWGNPRRRSAPAKPRPTVAELKRLTRERDDALRGWEHTKEWYAVRLEHIKELAKQHDLWPKLACILANGVADIHDPPTYAQQLNLAKWRAEKAEKQLVDLRAALADAQKAGLLRTCCTFGCDRIATHGYVFHDSVLYACDEHSSMGGEFREHPHWTPLARRLIGLLLFAEETPR